jgi:hypothetical protein
VVAGDEALRRGSTTANVLLLPTVLVTSMRALIAFDDTGEPKAQSGAVAFGGVERPEDVGEVVGSDALVLSFTSTMAGSCIPR